MKRLIAEIPAKAVFKTEGHWVISSNVLVGWNHNFGIWVTLPSYLPEPLPWSTWIWTTAPFMLFHQLPLYLFLCDVVLRTPAGLSPASFHLFMHTPSFRMRPCGFAFLGALSHEYWRGEVNVGSFYQLVEAHIQQQFRCWQRQQFFRYEYITESGRNICARHI